MFTSWWFKTSASRQPSPPTTTWLEPLMALSLHNINRSLQTTWYIDKEETLDAHVAVAIRLNAILSPALAEFIATYTTGTTERILWVQRGVLVAVQPTFPLLGERLSHEYICKQYGIIIVKVLPVSRSFTIITTHRVWEDISSYYALALLKQLIP